MKGDCALGELGNFRGQVYKIGAMDSNAVVDDGALRNCCNRRGERLTGRLLLQSKVGLQEEMVSLVAV